MRIQLLGTGAADGWPSLFCRCDACRGAREQGGKNLRSRSSAIVDGLLKIDFPPDTLHHVLTQNLDLSRVEHLLFTHGHADHFAVDELQYLSWMFLPYEVERPLHVVGPRDVLRRIQATPDYASLPLRLEAIAARQTAACGEYTVTAIEAAHAEQMECLNYLIARDGHTLLYATDTGWYAEETWQFLEARRLDGVVVECTKGPEEGGYMAHLSIPQVIAFRERLLASGALAPDAPVVTTHHSHLGGLLHEELEQRLNPHGIQVGYDGMTLTI